MNDKNSDVDHDSLNGPSQSGRYQIRLLESNELKSDTDKDRKWPC